VGDDTLTWDDFRSRIDQLSDKVGDWQGIPIPIEELPLRLHEKHPLREFFAAEQRRVDIEVLVGGPDVSDPDAPLTEQIGAAFQRALDDTERVVNKWYDAAHNRDVYIFNRGDGADMRAFAVTGPRSPDQSMDRLELWFNTMFASDAWDMNAADKAREKLRGMLNDKQWQTYNLTGAFIETSKRSGLIYMFRRLRPTIAMTGKHPWFRKRDTDHLRCLAVLCLHPIGYYGKSWGGCMVPTDDVIAHLLMMRGDEAYFWRKANQHEFSAPEAGL